VELRGSSFRRTYRDQIDPDTWINPEPPRKTSASSRNQWKVQEDFAYQCRKYGIKGCVKSDGTPKQPGRRTIAEAIAKVFPDPTAETKALGYKRADEDTVNGWIAKWTAKWGKVELSPPEPDYSVVSVPSEWKAYAARLSAISEFWHGYPLKGYEAEYLPYVGAAFNDPLGEKVDLIPQLAIVREVARLYTADRTRELWEPSIEHYLTYAPWKFGWEFAYEQQKERNASGKEQKVFAIEPSDFFMLSNSEDNWREVSPVFEDALRQLGLQWAAMYLDVGVVTPFQPSGVFKFVSTEFYGDESKGTCKWNTILSNYSREEGVMKKLKWKDDQTPLEDLGDLMTEQTSGQWIRHNEWKQMQFMPIEGSAILGQPRNSTGATL
jgi:hypothetical protein